MAQQRPSRRFISALVGAGLAVALAGVGFFKSQRECKATPQKSPTAESARESRAGTPAAPRSGQGSAAALGASSAAGTGEGTPVDILVAQPEELTLGIPATGTLLPRESVTLVSEVSRRLVQVSAEEGKVVKKGDILFRLDSADLSAQRNRLEVQLKLAERTAQRQTELLAESATTEAEADAATSSVDELRAQLRVLDVELAKTTIRAPFSGVLGLRQVSEGAWVTPATPLITVSDTRELKIDFRVPERHAGRVRPGTEFTLRVEGGETPLLGTVLATEPSIDETSRSLLVRGLVKMQETQEVVVPGSFAQVELPVVDTGAILLPPTAVVPGLSGVSVYVVKDGVARLIPVEQGTRTESSVQITAGLAPGDQVIVSNLLRLRNGAPVRVVTGAAP